MNLPCLGIDIAKVKFNVCLLRSNGKLKHKVFPNHAAGFAQLQAWLEQHEAPQVHACLEATGTYGEALSHYLHDRGHTVSVMNPAAIKAFAARLNQDRPGRCDLSPALSVINHRPGLQRQRKCASYKHLCAGSSRSLKCAWRKRIASLPGSAWQP